MVSRAARISIGSDFRLSWKVRAVPWKLPRTLTGMPMAASALAMEVWASLRDFPGARLKETVAASSVSWWLIEAALARSVTSPREVSGTMGEACVLTAAPVEESFRAGLALAAEAALAVAPGAVFTPVTAPVVAVTAALELAALALTVVVWAMVLLGGLAGPVWPEVTPVAGAWVGT